MDTIGYTDNSIAQVASLKATKGNTSPARPTIEPKIQGSAFEKLATKSTIGEFYSPKLIIDTSSGTTSLVFRDAKTGAILKEFGPAELVDYVPNEDESEAVERPQQPTSVDVAQYEKNSSIETTESLPQLVSEDA